MQPATTVVVHPCDETSLRGTIEAAEAGIIKPDSGRTRREDQEVAPRSTASRDRQLRDRRCSAQRRGRGKSVELIREAKGELLMKGSLHTDELMREVTSARPACAPRRRISHVFIMDVPTYPETLFITDAAINIFPDLDVKRDIIQNAIDLFTRIGLGTPGLPSCRRWKRSRPRFPRRSKPPRCARWPIAGRSPAAMLDGPLAFDNAIDPEAAEIKGIKS